MGLLDDAIREHLELKRQHGADPAEVAAQEREVLSSGRPPAAAPAGDPVHDDDLPGAVAEAPRDEVPPPAVAQDDPFADLGPPPPDPAEPAGAVSLGRFAPQAEPDIDWSEPAPAAEPEPEPAADAAADDVLEETPEFLEETPEHDRLWFEQRPPKDFDF